MITPPFLFFLKTSLTDLLVDYTELLQRLYFVYVLYIFKKHCNLLIVQYEQLLATFFKIVLRLKLKFSFLTLFVKLPWK